MVVLDRNWRCDLGEIDLVLRDGDVLVVCEVKTRSSAAYGHPLEAVDPGQGRPAAAARRALARGARRRSPTGCGSTWSACCSPSAAPPRSSTCRGGLMVATTRTVSLQGAVGHLVDVQVDLSARPGRHRPGRPAGRLDHRGARPVPGGGHQQRLRLARHAARHGPALAGRPAQARTALRPGHRRGGARGRRPRIPRERWTVRR